MSLTGKIGSSDSQPGNIQPGLNGIARSMGVSVGSVAFVTDAISRSTSFIVPLALSTVFQEGLSRKRFLVAAFGAPIYPPAMNFTNRLGTSSSRLGNVTLGPLTTVVGPTVAETLSVKRAFSDVTQGTSSLNNALSTLRTFKTLFWNMFSHVSEGLVVARALRSPVLGVSNVTNSMGRLLSFSDAMVSTAVVGDPLSIRRSVASSVSSTAGFAEPLLIARALVEAVQGGATFSETVFVSRGLAAALQGMATATGPVAVTRPFALPVASLGQLLLSVLGDIISLQVALSGVATQSEVMIAARALDLQLPVTADFTEFLSVDRSVVVDGKGQAFATGALGVERTFTEAIDGAAETTETLSVLRSLLEAINGNTALSAGIQRSRALALDLEGGVALSNALALALALLVTVDSPTSVTVDLSEKLSLLAHLGGAGSLSELLTLVRLLRTVLVGQSTQIDSLAILRSLFAHVGSLSFASMATSDRRRLALGLHSRASLTEAMTLALSLTVPVTTRASLSDHLSVGRVLGAQANASGLLSERLSVRRSLSLLATANALLVPTVVTSLFITSNGTLLTVIVPSTLLRVDGTSDSTHFEIDSLEDGVPTAAFAASPIQQSIATGTDGVVLARDTFAFGWPTIGIGNYLVVSSRWQNTMARVIASPSPGVAVLDTSLLVDDPDSGAISWRLFGAVIGVVLTIHEPTDARSYSLALSGLLTLEGKPYSASARWIAHAAGASLLTAACVPETDAVVVTFSNEMLIDKALLNPAVYRISGPTLVSVVAVQTVSPTQILLDTLGLDAGAYTLTVQSGPIVLSTVTIDGPKNISKNFVPA